jgi:hypothetical protein
VKKVLANSEPSSEPSTHHTRGEAEVGRAAEFAASVENDPQRRFATINCRSAKSLFDHFVKRRGNASSQSAASGSNQAMTSRVWK